MLLGNEVVSVEKWHVDGSRRPRNLYFRQLLQQCVWHLIINGKRINGVLFISWALQLSKIKVHEYFLHAGHDLDILLHSLLQSNNKIIIPILYM